MMLPADFGYRTSWIAVRTIRPELLAAELELARPRPCDWDEGLRAAAGTAVFISPSVSGWTLIIGITLPDASTDDTLSLVVRLSETHRSAQYFGNHRVPNYYAWAKAENGRLVRAYAYVGEIGETVWDRGEPTKDESDLGLIFTDVPHSLGEQESGLDRISLQVSHIKYPTESDVFAIAGRWSIDPTRIEDYTIDQSLGIVGFLK